MIVFSPAKIILSGEHSVVYGAPAIGAPLAMFLRSRWETRADGAVVLSFRGVEKILAASWADLIVRLPAWRARQARFRAGEIQIREVLTEPEDLAALTLAVFGEWAARDLPGVTIAVETDIPVSSGLGSSSALILNLLEGMSRMSGLDLPDRLSVARGIEDFQHGTSSGLDLALVAGRRPLVFIRGQGIVGEVGRVPDSFVLIHSGTPSVSTGQCVAAVRAAFGDGHPIWSDFAACTAQMKAAFESDDTTALHAAVARNQALLESIGVVPDRVRAFVSACTALGIPAKICGAGAVAGEGAGMLWALPSGPDSEEALARLAREFGYGHGRYAVAR